MSLAIYNGKYVVYNGQYGIYTPSSPTLNFKLSVIRNAEMDNTLGNALSTDLTISAIDGSVLTIPNLPVYSGFSECASTWAARVNTESGTVSLCTNIDDSAKTVTVTNVTPFQVSDTIALYNPFLNYQFSGNQMTQASIPPNGSYPWMGSATGGGPILPKDGSVYRWLFYGRPVSGSISVGLATSYDMETWDVSNNNQPVMTGTELVGSGHAYVSGDAIVIDNSIYCLIGTTAGARMACFDMDVSNWSASDVIMSTGSLVGGLTEHNGNYHILLLDNSLGVLADATVVALKSSNIMGPYVPYQRITKGSDSSYGTAWDWITDNPGIINDGHTIMGIFGAQGLAGSYGSGCGITNREYCLLDFDKDLEIWSINTKGPVLINPIDWPNSDWSWCHDHCGGYISTFIENSNMYLGFSMKGYAGTMLKLTNFI